MSDETTDPIDPLELMRDAYSRGLEAWSSAMEELVGSEEFAAGSGQLLAFYAQQQEAIRTASTLAAESVHFPTTEDVAKVATLVTNVERAVDDMARSTEGFLPQLTALGRGVDAAPAAVVAALESRIGAIEASLGRVETALGGIEAKLNDVAKAAPAKKTTTRSRTSTARKSA